MARYTNRDFFNALGSMWGIKPREATVPLASSPVPRPGQNTATSVPTAQVPAVVSATTVPVPTPENPLGWMFNGTADRGAESIPVPESSANSGANETMNDQTWSNPNAATAAFEGDAGFGREDAPIGSSPAQASGFVRTNISPGGTTGGISTVPTPMRLPGDTVKVMEGDTLKTLAQRSLGDPSFWPRLHVLQNDYIVKGGSAGDMVLKAGTVLPIN